jgi:hypothetical protein
VGRQSACWAKLTLTGFAAMLLLVILDGFCPNDDKFAAPHVEAERTNRSPSSKESVSPSRGFRY